MQFWVTRGRRPANKERVTAAFRALVLVLAIHALPATATAQVSFGPPVGFPSGDASTATAVGDFNQDADPDLAVVNVSPDTVSVLLGAPGAAFSARSFFAATSAPAEVATGDFNGDGDPDLAVAGFNGVAVLLGGVGGSFSPQTVFPANVSPSSIAVGEFNGDLDPDLAVTNGVAAGTVSILLGGAGGTFQAPVSFSAGNLPASIVVADFNGDGDSDLATANSNTDNVSILLGQAGATFSAPTTFAAGNFPNSIAAADFNGDGDPDLAVTSQLSDTVSILLGGAAGSFSGPTNLPVGTFNFPLWVETGDLNGDGDPDLAVANRDRDNVSVFLGAAGGSFSAPTAVASGDGPQSVVLANFDGDGDRDMAVANGNSDNVTVHVNGGAKPPGPTPPATVPPPVLGRTANVELVRGTVLVALPKGARSARTGRASSVKGLRFVPLRGLRQIPIGSFLNTRRGTVRLTTASNFAGSTQSGTFRSGIFQVLQARRARAVTSLRLDGGSFRSCRVRRSSVATAAARRSRRTIRRLRSNARGRFRTRGRHSAATVRGTVWLTADRCDGTLTRVRRGRVVVRDLRRRKSISLRAGRSYLARPRR